MNRPTQEDSETFTLSGARIERLMNVVRWAASGLVIGIGPFLPNIGFEAVIVLGAGMFVLSTVLALMGRLLKDSKGRSLISHVALAGDALAGMATVLVFPIGPERGAMMAVGVILIGTGAFRGGAIGCLATLVATAAGFVAAQAIRYDAGAALDLSNAALTLTTYALAATIFMGWHAEVRRVLLDRAATAARLTLVGRAANDVIYEWDFASGALTLSAATATQLGYHLDDPQLERSWWEERLHPEDAGPVLDALATLLRSAQQQWEMEYRFRKADGSFTTVHDHGYVQWSRGRRKRPVRMVGTLVNVDSVSLYDPITGLAGRAVFTDRVERRAVSGAISGEAFAVVVVDIQEFRSLSARLGQTLADDVLLELARRFETHLGEGETVARVAHDQLGFLVNAKTADDAVARAAQIRDSARIPFGEEQEIKLDVVAGGAVLPQGGEPDLMRQALAALADAKRTKRRVAVYEPGGEKRWDERVRLRDDLVGALARRELELHYQPIAETESGRCVALEAFIRWDHPSLGLLDAGELLQIASDLDLGPEIDRWVLSEATRTISKLRRTRGDLGISVNIAVGTLDEDLPASLRAALAGSLLPGDALTIELPEDPALAMDPAATVLKDLRSLGVGIAIDDFGTGYASLMPEPAIPATLIKIDRVFAGRVVGDEHAARIVRSAVELAHELGLRVVGEGVGDSATIEQLRAMKVDLVQGRGVARPMTLGAVTKWLAQGTAAATDPARALARRVMIGENEPKLVPATAPAAASSGTEAPQPATTEAVTVEAVTAEAVTVEAVTTETPTSAGASPPLAAVEADAPALYAYTPQPTDPDPMGWIIPRGAELARPSSPLPAAEPEPTFDEARATAFAAAVVPELEPAAVPEAPAPIAASKTPAPTATPVGAPARPHRKIVSFRPLRPGDAERAEKAARVAEAAAVIAEAAAARVVDMPTAAGRPAERIPGPKDLRLVALESAGRRWASAHGRGNEEPDRLDERLVLLREYARRKELGNIAS